MLCFDKSWMLWFIFILNERFWRKGKDRKVIIPDLRKFGIMIPWRKRCLSRKIPIARGMGRWQNHFLNGLKKDFMSHHGTVLITLWPSFLSSHDWNLLLCPIFAKNREFAISSCTVELRGNGVAHFFVTKLWLNC